MGRDNIEMDLKETAKGDVDWSYLSQNRHKWRAVVNTVMNIWFSQNVVDFFTSYGTASF